MKAVTLHTDGSCEGNPGPGGWAAILVHGEHERELSGGEPQTTNNRMELRAVVEGLRALKEPCRVVVRSDSQYVVKAFRDDWISGWKRRGWKTAKKEPVANRELWEALAAEAERHEVEWTWVRGHAGDAHNERCHVLAVAASQQRRGLRGV